MLWQWSTTAGNNANVGSINWAEGMPPSAVNNSARQMMADVADWVNNPGPQWYQADSVSYASGTTFTIAATDSTANYPAGRRLRAVNSGGTIYGAVVSATFSTNTTVTAAWDSGSLDAGLSSLKVGIITPDAVSLPANWPLSVSALAVTSKLTVGGTTSISGAIVMSPSSWHVDGVLSLSSTSQITGIFQNNGGSMYLKYACSGGAKHVGVIAGNFDIINSANTAVLMTVDDSGNLTATANITANSDERFKDEWVAPPDDMVDRLALLLSGSYTRTDLIPPARQVGVGAQTFLKVFPELSELVQEDQDGKLSFAYGQAAMVACIELAKEVRRLKQIIEKMGRK